MSGFGAFLFSIGALVFPFVAAFLLWRRMKSVRDRVYRDHKTEKRETPWEEDLATDGDLSLTRVGKVNHDLAELGARARETRWPIDNQ